MSMSESAKEARRAYDRAYYRRNPEKQREKMRRYWERKSAQNQAQEGQDLCDEDGQIKGIENTISYLKQERKELNKKIMTNRQSIAQLQNVLKELKEQRRRSNDQGPR